MKRILLLLFVALFTTSLSYATYQIYVRQPSGEILTLDVNQGDTFNSVKAKIQDKTGIHPARQRLIYAGKVLEGGKTLGDYNIQREDMLHVEYRLCAVKGKLPGAFSVSSTKQIWFSQGNLQYQPDNGNGGSTWRFATNQYDAIGSDNSNVSPTYSGWIDKFGWGSGNQPTQTSTDPNVYSTFVDWGIHAISNGGNTANQWRTLSESEWTYLISTRPNASSKRGRATVNGMYCFVLLPDEWELPTGLSFTSDNNNWTNVYTEEQWIQMEDAGAVCFPAAGTRAGGANNTNVNNYNEWGCYWSSTSANGTQAYNLWITSDHVGTTDKGNYQMGASVRLVSETMFPGSGTAEDPYLINSEEAWNYLADQVNAGTNYSNTYFRQTGDFTVSSKIIGYPTDDTHFVTFNGIYDGNGCTITASISKTGERYVAPFHCIANATIKNVIVTGSVTVSGSASIERRRHPAGLVGVTDGTCIIQNCMVSANVSGCDYIGGILGHSMGANLTMTGCVYTGTLTASGANYTGGLIGWGGGTSGLNVSIENCLFAGSYSGSGKFHPVGCYYTPDTDSRSVSNTYYTVAATMNENDGSSFVKGLSYRGKFAYLATCSTGVAVNPGGSVTTYDVSGISTNGIGLIYNNTVYAGSDDVVSLALSHDENPGYTFSHYTVTGGGTLANPTTNSPTLTMTNANQTINATWTRNEVTLTDGEGVTSLSAFIGQQCDVTYSRSFTEGKASTVCLPFAYTKKEGDGSFYAFTDITKENGNYVATMTESSVSTLTANTPYLYMPSTTGNVDFSGTYTIPAELTAGSTTSGDWTFVGTYETVSWEEAPTGIYGFSAQNVDAQGISQGEFVKVGAYVRVRPMRCFLRYGDGTSDFAGAPALNSATADEELPETISVRLVSASGDITAIGTLHTQTGEVTLDGWYTLDGTRLSGKPTRKGIYVNNGKKVVIK